MDAYDIAKDVRDLKRKLDVTIDGSSYGTRIIALAVAKFPLGNDNLRIPTTMGHPICEDVHDSVRDCYLVEGVDYLDLGEIPINISIQMDDVHGWQIDVPIPFVLIKRYMSSEQKVRFNRWKQSFCSRDYNIEFMQLRNVY